MSSLIVEPSHRSLSRADNGYVQYPTEVCPPLPVVRRRRDATVFPLYALKILQWTLPWKFGPKLCPENTSVAFIQIRSVTLQQISCLLNLSPQLTSILDQQRNVRPQISSTSFSCNYDLLEHPYACACPGMKLRKLLTSNIRAFLCLLIVHGLHSILNRDMFTLRINCMVKFYAQQNWGRPYREEYQNEKSYENNISYE